jgi:hypothetical protein
MRNNCMGVLMSFNKHLIRVGVAGAVLAVGASAEAKGPQGVGAGASSSNSASSSSQDIGSNSWTQPPGWSKAEGSKGWDGGTSPPGFDAQGKATV